MHSYPGFPAHDVVQSTESMDRLVFLWEQRFLGPDGRVNIRLLGSGTRFYPDCQAQPKHCSYQKYRTDNWN